ncbi:MAG: hypothetical protein H0U76_27980 [Ktedonobacteraceae bacterium]|nr:hypothetical protein [Ktedonobacteraceae bacterium]MBA3824702.1 hypothetical protein [Ktedonobacterales bacterium]
MQTGIEVGNYSSGLYGLPHMGEVIADYRSRKGWKSQEAFAIVCGVDRQTVAYWERKEYLADMDRRIFIAKMLKVPPALLGLTWLSMADQEKTANYAQTFQQMARLSDENLYTLYEDILSFAYTSTDKYSPSATYRFYKHQQELKKLVQAAPEVEKESWEDLLSRYYQLSMFMEQHHNHDPIALTYGNEAVDLATDINDARLLSAALYRRARMHIIQNRLEQASTDIIYAQKQAKHASKQLRGSIYLLGAEIQAHYAEQDATLKKQCHKWQELATNILYKENLEDDGTFIYFDLYAVHHERAKMLTRFALFHATDNELVEQLKHPDTRADKGILHEAHGALSASRSHLDAHSFTKEMYLSITEARMYLLAREFEESARTAKHALRLAQKAHSNQGRSDVEKIYAMLNAVAKDNPYISNLGVELGIFG